MKKNNDAMITNESQHIHPVICYRVPISFTRINEDLSQKVPEETCFVQISAVGDHRVRVVYKVRKDPLDLPLLLVRQAMPME